MNIVDPLEVYKLVENRYDSTLEETIETFNKTFKGYVEIYAPTFWCGIRDQMQDYLPKSLKHLDAGCGEVCRGTEGFDLRFGVSFRQALDIYEPGSFDVVTAYGSLHSAMKVTKTKLPGTLITNHIDTDDVSVLYSDSSFSIIDNFSNDNNILVFHASCLANWSSDYVGITIRSHYASLDKLKRLGDKLGMTTVAEFYPDFKDYTQRVIDYYQERSVNFSKEDRIGLLKELYLIKNDYINNSPVGIVWRKK